MVSDLCRLVSAETVTEGGAGDGGGEGVGSKVTGALYITTLNRTKLSYGLGELVCVYDGGTGVVSLSVCVCVCMCVLRERECVCAEGKGRGAGSPCVALGSVCA